MALSTIFTDFNSRKNNIGFPKFRMDYSSDDKSVLQYLDRSNTFIIDASISELYTHEAELSDDAVERGLNVTDHYNPKPVVVTMKMLHSEYPIGLDSLASGLATSAGQFASKNFLQNSIGQEAGGVAAGAAGAPALLGLVNKKSDARTRVATTYELFSALIEAKAVITVVTGLKEYKDMMIKSMVVSRDKSSGQALDFTVTLQRVRFVDSKTLKLPKIKNKSTNNRASGKTDAGKESGKEIKPESALHRAGGFIKNLFSNTAADRESAATGLGLF